MPDGGLPLSSPPLEPRVGPFPADKDVPADQNPHHEFGEKTITFWGSCVLNFNNITGPAVIVLPLLFQQAGWLLPCAGLLLMFLCSSLAATMLVEGMQRVPGNRAFRHRLEYCALVAHYFGQKASYLAQVGFNAGLTASNILSMVITAQVLDSAVQRLAGSTYGLSYASWPPQLLASPGRPAGGVEGGCPWGVLESGACNRAVISLGYVVAMGVCVPLGWLNLEDNMAFQWASMWAQLLCSLQFAGEFVMRMLPGSPSYCAGTGPAHTPLVGLDYSQVVGVCVFAYSYVSTIPSWANEKKPGVSVNKAVWLPATVGVFLNILLGLLGAWAYSLLDMSGPSGQPPRPYSGTDDLLNLLDGQADPRVFTCAAAAPGGVPATSFSVSPLTELSVYVWGIGGYVPGIPVLAIMVRYNLQSSGVLGPRGAFFWAVVAPWAFTAFFYQAEALLQFCSWVALLCQGFINLIVPVLLYREALRRYPTPRELEEQEASGEPSSRGLVSSLARKGSGSWRWLERRSSWSALFRLSSKEEGQDGLRQALLAGQDKEHAIAEGEDRRREEGQAIVSLHVSDSGNHLVMVAPAPLPAHGGGVLQESRWRIGGGQGEEGEELVSSVPRWLGIPPRLLANSLGVFVTVAVAVSITLGILSPS